MPTTYEDAVTEAHAEERQLVQVERNGASAVVTLDDPEKFNPLSLALTVQLHRQLNGLAEDPQLRAVVLTGRDPAFCAGGDLRIMQDVARPMLEEGPEGAIDIWRWISRCPATKLDTASPCRQRRKTLSLTPRSS